MSDVDPRLERALRAQLGRRRPGARRIGWKHGSSSIERIGGEIAVGNLTSDTALASGATYEAGGGDLHADAEVAVEIAESGSIAGYAAAVEIVDLARRGTPEEIVVDNDFHCAVAFGPFSGTLPRDLEAALEVNGELRAVAPSPEKLAERVAAIDRVLRAVGERLLPGDRVITGSIVQVPVGSGDEVTASIGSLGRATVYVA